MSQRLPEVELNTNLTDIIALPFIILSVMIESIAFLIGGRVTDHILMRIHIRSGSGLIKRFKKYVERETGMKYEEYKKLKLAEEGKTEDDIDDDDE